ncbi:HU family DNA-binding protein [Sulfitobacter sp. R18_1]|uniref:HU family DNA-binding protein n=1 Tax=Sulfitobacter sp. R18_1 TaxID=2821104 RepID=UPI001ADD3B9A|nr:HU family DNA-binding protein [Sulfitobacter sp. R18_1]MBO9428004.1 integration host factor subunit beta [Sulfitobacter sp. R18_1]
MIKSELVSRIAEEFALSRKVSERAVSQIFDEIIEQMASGGRVEIRDFGVFGTSEYDSSVGRNPRTGESVELPARTLPRFKAGRGLSKRLNQDFEKENS